MSAYVWGSQNLKDLKAMKSKALYQAVASPPSKRNRCGPEAGASWRLIPNTRLDRTDVLDSKHSACHVTLCSSKPCNVGSRVVRFLASEVPLYAAGATGGKWADSRIQEHPIQNKGTSFTRKRTPLGPYRGPIPRILGGSWGGGRCLMGEVPL